GTHGHRQLGVSGAARGDLHAHRLRRAVASVHARSNALGERLRSLRRRCGVMLAHDSKSMVPLASRETWRAFSGESGDAFAIIGAVAQLALQIAFEVELRGEAVFGGGVKRPLGRRETRGRRA